MRSESFLYILVGFVVGFIFWRTLLLCVLKKLAARNRKEKLFAACAYSFVKYVYFSVPFAAVRFLLGVCAILSKKYDMPNWIEWLISGIPEISDRCCAFFSAIPPHVLNADQAIDSFTFAVNTFRYLDYSNLIAAVKLNFADILLAIGKFCIGCISINLVVDLYALLYAPFVFIVAEYLCFVFAKWKNLSKDKNALWFGFTLMPRKIYIDGKDNPYTDLTAAPGDTFDDYVSTSKVIKYENGNFLKSYSKLYGEFHEVDRDCFVQYPVEAIDDMIKNLKRTARYRNMKAAFHKANLFDRPYACAVFMTQQAFAKIGYVFLYIWNIVRWAALRFLSILRTSLGLPILLTMLWLFIEYKLFTWVSITHGLTIFPIIFLFVPLIRIWVEKVSWMKWNRGREYHSRERHPKWNDLTNKGLKKKKSKEIHGAERNCDLKHAVKRYHSTREDDTFNVSERLSELTILKWISNPNTKVNIYATDKLQQFIIVKGSHMNKRVVFVNPCCVEKGVPTASDRRGLYYKIDLLNHIKTAD